MSEMTDVTRLEVIDCRRDMPSAGRAFVAYQCAVSLSVQDDGRTLKVFVDDRPSPRAATTEGGTTRHE